MFFNDEDDPKSAEIEVMIAEKRSRSKGLAKEALLLLSKYSIETLGMKKFVAKVKYSFWHFKSWK